MKIVYFTFLALLPSVEIASADEYSLFNPTPRDKMRDFSTDRPDKTESAYTVDAGHFQHETDIINYTFDSEGGTRSESWLFTAPNLKAGLTENIDLQVVVETFNYNREKDKGTGEQVKFSGYGDTLVRLKYNVWGNDGGDTALAIMPYLKFPTNRGELGNNGLEGGLISPYVINFTPEFGIGAMTQVDIVRDNDNEGYHGEFVQSATVGKDFTDELGAYVELWGSLSPERGPLLTADCGITYAFEEDTQFDIGINVGLSDQSDDLNPFIGLSQRF